MSGFGQTGPYAQRPGYDLIAQGLSGVMSVTGEPDGDPVKCGIPIGDLSAGLFCAVGILSAVVARERTGRGQRIDTSLFEGALALSIWETAELWGTGRVPQPLGSGHRLLAPYQALRTADGHITVGANNQRMWRLLCETIGRPELIDDARFASNDDRMERRVGARGRAGEGVDERGARTSGSTCWSRPACRAGRSTTTARCSRTRTRRRARWRSQVDGTRMLGIPVKLSDTPGSVRRAAPGLGEHSGEVLREAGFSDAEIAAL